MGLGVRVVVGSEPIVKYVKKLLPVRQYVKTFPRSQGIVGLGVRSHFGSRSDADPAIATQPIAIGHQALTSELCVALSF